jgi:hypothetical protein
LSIEIGHPSRLTVQQDCLIEAASGEGLTDQQPESFQRAISLSSSRSGAQLEPSVGALFVALTAPRDEDVMML